MHTFGLPFVSRPGPIAAIIAGVLSASTFAPTPAWANGAIASPAIASEAQSSTKSFDDTSEEASGLMLVADFNGDDIADIAKANLPVGDPSGPGVLTVSLGKSDGTYQQAFSKPMLGRDPRSMVAVDINQDGILDLIVGDGNGALVLFLGDGTGVLFAAGNIAHLHSMVSIAVADFKPRWHSGHGRLRLAVGLGDIASWGQRWLIYSCMVVSLGDAGNRAVPRHRGL
jgi:hypothetical protein